MTDVSKIDIDSEGPFIGYAVSNHGRTPASIENVAVEIIRTASEMGSERAINRVRLSCHSVKLRWVRMRSRAM